MYSNVIMTGFGGQGVQMISQLLVVSSINKGYEVTYLPSYGVEKRGGRTDVTVVMADEEIGSPITNIPYILIAMDTIGLNFYQKMVKPEGIIIANTSLITSDNFNRDDLEIVKIDSNDEALKLGHSRYANAPWDLGQIVFLPSKFPTLPMQFCA